MKRKVQIYIEDISGSGDYNRIELFEDEKINVNLSVQNVQDISKVYTDFSQSFSVPASPTNNRIFQHFYNSDVEQTIDQNLRRKAYIEIDLTPFRTGKIQLEKSSLKNGKVESYQITFYGELLSLKDKFKDVKLKDLDYSSIAHDYDYTNVKTRITSDATDYDVRYPLITSSRLWSYGDASSTDITQTSSAIDYTELFPAIRVKKIFDFIETKFNVTFQSLFLSDKKFTDLFLYCKNSETPNIRESKDVDIISQTNHFGTTSDNAFDLTNDKLYVNSATADLDPTSGYYDSYHHYVKIAVFGVTDVNATYYIDVYRNDNFEKTIKGKGNNTYAVDWIPESTGLADTFNFKVSSPDAVTLTCNVLYSKEWVFYSYIGNTTTIGAYNYTGLSSSLTFTGLDLNLSNTMPDMLVEDFFKGILSMFNLTCVYLGNDTYELEPLDDWYRKGAVIDVTEYTDVTSIEVERLKLYKSINFEHEKSESFINRQFFDNNGTEYGDLKKTFNYDGEDYNIKVPFENLNFNLFTSTSTQVGYCLTKQPDFKPYIPKPILLYNYGKLSTGAKITDGTTTDSMVNYIAFGQDNKVNNYNMSINFGSEISTLLNAVNPNSIYNTYYFGYLSNMFNLKNRITKVLAKFPISLITGLQLNDRLIIRDKRYIINEISTDITQGEVNLVLINDFRDVLNDSGYIDTAGGNTYINFHMPNGGISTTFTGSTGTSVSPSTTTTSTAVTFTTPSTGTYKKNRITEDGKVRVSENIVTRIHEDTDTVHTMGATTTYTNGSTTTTNYTIIQTKSPI